MLFPASPSLELSSSAHRKARASLFFLGFLKFALPCSYWPAYSVVCFKFMICIFFIKDFIGVLFYVFLRGGRRATYSASWDFPFPVQSPCNLSLSLACKNLTVVVEVSHG